MYHRKQPTKGEEISQKQNKNNILRDFNLRNHSSWNKLINSAEKAIWEDQKIAKAKTLENVNFSIKSVKHEIINKNTSYCK